MTLNLVVDLHLHVTVCGCDSNYLCWRVRENWKMSRLAFTLYLKVHVVL